MGYTFALCTETTDVSVSDLYRLKFALEINAAHCAQAWGRERPAFEVIDSRRRLPKGCHPIVFLDEGGDPETLAHHYWDPIRLGPAARVFTDKASGFNTGRFSIAEAASHEALEAVVDPAINLWSNHPRLSAPPDWQMAVEVCDPVQTHYEVKASGEVWRMANFITPAYFYESLNTLSREDLDAWFADGNRLDWSGELRRPGEIGPEGYAIVRKPKPGGWAYFTENSAGETATFDSRQTRDKSHRWARTYLRGIRL